QGDDHELKPGQRGGRRARDDVEALPPGERRQQMFHIDLRPTFVAESRAMRMPTPRLRPVGVIRSALKARAKAPRQGSEGAPDAWLVVEAWAADCIDGLAAGDEIIVLTWFHQAVL